jgi:hypothetical protein
MKTTKKSKLQINIWHNNYNNTHHVLWGNALLAKYYYNPDKQNFEIELYFCPERTKNLIFYEVSEKKAISKIKRLIKKYCRMIADSDGFNFRSMRF